MTGLTHLTTGELASRRPELLDLFDRLGIDYCCHGSMTIDEACRRAGLDPDEVVRQVNDAIPPPPIEPDWTTRTMSELCDHIETTHHVRTRRLLERAKSLLPRILEAHGAAHPEYRELAAIVDVVERDMADHMIREERVLFPWLRRLENPRAVNVGPPWSVQRPIDCMMHDHEVVAGALEKMRRLTNTFSPPQDACGAVRSLLETLREFDHDTRRHVHKENNILFPAGLRAEQARTVHA